MLAADSTRDQLHTRVTLAEGVRFRPERTRGRDGYVIEDPDQNRFFRVGLAEYTFISLLDENTSPAEAVSLTARALGPDALGEEQANSILTWLTDNGLATAIASSATRSTAQTHREAKRHVEKLNPFWLKIPLANPDRLVGLLTRVFSWFYSWPAVCSVALLFVAAGLMVGGQWAEFCASSRSILSTDNWLWLTGVWLCLKLIHEASHAIACRRLGAAVPETGVIFVLLAPLAYVDVTTSLRFSSRWQRIQIAAAGMYAELTLGAVALIFWTLTTAELPRHLLHNIVVMATVTSLLFNANPLMRFDGYYIFSDVLDIPNLYSRGNAAVRRVLKRALTGLSETKPADSGLTGTILLVYGLAAIAWRLMVCVGLLIAASVLFHGLGVVLTAVGIFLWVARPLFRGVVAAWRLLQFQPTVFLRASVLCGTAGAAVVCGLVFVPTPASRVAPGVIDYRDSAVVRSDGSGFVRSINAVDGQHVEAGDVLVICENLDLEVEVGDLETAIEQSVLRYNQSLKDHDPATAQVELENRRALEKRLTEKQSQLAALTIRAPVSGRVMSRQLRWQTGAFVKEGDEMLVIGNERMFEFRAGVDESHAHLLHAGDPVSIRLRGVALTGAVEQIAPRATRKPFHDSLIAPNGGPLPVVATDESQGDQYSLVTPKIEVTCSIDSHLLKQLRSGSAGSVHLSSLAGIPIGRRLYTAISNMIREKTSAAAQK